MKRRNGTLMLMAALFALVSVSTLQGSDKPNKRGGNARQRGGTVARHVQMLESLKALVDEQMTLEAEQKEKIDTIFAEQIRHIREMSAKWDKSRSENTGRIAKLRAEQAKARQERNMERLRELQIEMRDLIGPNTGLRMANNDFDARVLDELNRKQADQYRALAREARLKATMMPTQESRGVRYFRMAGKLDLSREQWTELRRLFRTHKSLWSQDASDPRVTKADEAKLRSGILEVLNNDQREKFEVLERKLDNGESIEDAESKPRGLRAPRGERETP